MKIVFMGTPDFAVPTLEALYQSRHEVAAVVTQPDKPKGRGKAMAMPPVKEKALEYGIPVYQPVRVRKDEAFFEELTKIQPDVIVVIAFGQILPERILNLPKYGCINIHASLLPKYRGAAPIQWAVINGDEVSGVTTMQMDVGLDTGDMLHKLSCPISAQDTSASLYDKLAELGPQGLLETLTQLANGSTQPEVQDEALVTYAEKLSKEEARIDWSLSAAQLERCIRAFNPWPMSWLEIDEQPVKVWQASVIAETSGAEPGTIVAAGKQGIQIATGNGILNLESLQPAGKKAMSAQDLLNSRREWFIPGNRLS
mgnify:CR=1 FL=1